MLATQHPNSPKLVALQDERDKVYKEMLMFKEQVIELKEKCCRVREIKRWIDDLQSLIFLANYSMYIIGSCEDNVWSQLKIWKT